MIYERTIHRAYEILNAIDNLANVTVTIVNVGGTFQRIFNLILVHICGNFCRIQCYDFDKFEGYATEEEAEKRGLELIDSDGLWAVIAFQHEDLESTTTTLPFHVKYKIR